MTDNEFALAEQRMSEAYVDYRQLSAIVAEEQLRRDNAECNHAITLISKILPNFRVEKRDDGNDRITAYTDGITIFIYNYKQSDDLTFVSVEVSLSRSSDSVDLRVKELIVKLVAKLQGVIKAH